MCSKIDGDVSGVDEKVNWRQVMTHYRQIILNLAVEDTAQEQEEYLEKLKESLIEFIVNQTDEGIVKEVTARVN